MSSKYLSLKTLASLPAYLPTHPFVFLPLCRSRLGCQVCLNKKLKGITVLVPEGVADARTA